MVGAGALGRDQHEDDVDRLAVECVEIDRLLGAGEETDEAVDTRHPAVRDGDAIADAGRAEALALEQGFEQLAVRKARQRGGMLGKLLQSLLLAVGPQRRDHRGGAQKIGQRHSPVHACPVPAEKPSARVRFDGRSGSPAGLRTAMPADRSSRYCRRGGGIRCSCDHCQRGGRRQPAHPSGRARQQRR